MAIALYVSGFWLPRWGFRGTPAHPSLPDLGRRQVCNGHKPEEALSHASELPCAGLISGQLYLHRRGTLKTTPCYSMLLALGVGWVLVLFLFNVMGLKRSRAAFWSEQILPCVSTLHAAVNAHYPKGGFTISRSFLLVFVNSALLFTVGIFLPSLLTYPLSLNGKKP